MKKAIALAMASVMAAGLLAGCGSKSMSAQSDYERNAVYAETEAMRSYDVGTGNEAASAEDTATSGDVLPENRKWVITMDIDTETEDLDGAMEALREKVGAMGGYIQEQNVRNGSAYASTRYRNASLTLRIPADKLDSFTESLDGFSNVVSSSRSAEDITLSYTDTETRISMLKTEQSRLLDLMEQAETMSDLLEYYPALQSVSIVPAGLTKFRDGLYPLSPYTPDECREIVRQVGRMGDCCVEKFGQRIFFCADEIYIRGGLALPDADYYEGFDQLEDGVGLIAALLEDFGFAMEDARLPEHYDRRVTIETGTAAYSTISYMARRLCKAVTGLWVQVVAVRNDFFGESVTVAGLLTATDIAGQLKGMELGDAVIIPAVALRPSGQPRAHIVCAVLVPLGQQVVLVPQRRARADDCHIDWLSEQLGGVPVIPSQNRGDTFIRDVLGL